jgi:hypothetical protein
MPTRLASLLLVILLAACTAAPTPLAELSTSTLLPPTLTATQTLTPTASPTPTASLTPTLSPTTTSTATPTLTPEPLPVFTTKALRPGVAPLAYLPDACTYLSRRWAVDASPPGTVVVPVMFHSIVQSGRAVTDPKDISVEQFQAFVQYANYLGFETITTAQLLDFMENNAPIPPRAMLLILDDRRPGVVREHFMPVLQANDWTLTLAYIADPNSMQWAMDEILRLFTDFGHLEVQSHGYTGQLYIVEETSAEEIQNEIWESTTVLEEKFSQRPLAFIWPGGNFSALAAQIAREGGYRLGFTAFSRGPLMFNWVPQGEPEQEIADPLMLLSRAWSNSVNVNLDEAVRVGEQAVESARQQYAYEAEYYSTYCGGELPPLEQVLP